MDDPDVVVGIHIETDRLSDNPVVRQRLRPERIHLKLWRHNPCGLDLSLFADHCGANSERGCERENGGTHIQITLHI